jgi:hypothetical protein
MAVDENDLVGIECHHLGAMAQSDQVLRVLASRVVAHARLRHHEGLEAFAGKALKN